MHSTSWYDSPSADAGGQENFGTTAELPPVLGRVPHLAGAAAPAAPRYRAERPVPSRQPEQADAVASPAVQSDTASAIPAAPTPPRQAAAPGQEPSTENEPPEATATADTAPPGNEPAADGEFSSWVLQLQIWMRPLARVIVLAALLTAAGLLYLLLESPDGKNHSPAPESPSAPGSQLTATNDASPVDVETELPLRGGLPPSAQGPAGGYAPSPPVLAYEPVTDAPRKPEATSTPAEANVDAEPPTIASSSADNRSLDPYPNTGPSYRAAQIGPSGEEAARDEDSRGEPVSVARFTGDIQPIQK